VPQGQYVSHPAATGRHVATPGNLFWPALCAAGFTGRLLKPAEQDQLAASGPGITNTSPARPAQPPG
jgi:TDG/mug DNA glycosylase family protein